MSELLPCPFCGGDPTLIVGSVAFNDYEVQCDTCGFSGPNFGALDQEPFPREDAVRHWNTRTDVSDALIAAAYVDAANLHQSLWRETSAYKTDQILKRTSTDTRQALDALLKQAREEALREAAGVCERIRTQKISGPMPERACFDYEQSILALVENPAG